MEAFFAWYSGNTFEKFMIANRMQGPYAPAYWALIFCNIVTPQFLWFKRVRSSPILLWSIALVVSVGMWLERFVIIVVSLHRDFLPSAWGMFYPTKWDFMTLFGTIGLFLSLLFLFIRFLPMISIFEMRTLVPEARKSGKEAVPEGSVADEAGTAGGSRRNGAACGAFSASSRLPRSS